MTRVVPLLALAALLAVVGCKPPAPPAPAATADAVPTLPVPAASTATDTARLLEQLRTKRGEGQLAVADQAGTKSATDPAVIPGLLKLLDDKTCNPEGKADRGGLPSSVREAAVIALLRCGPAGEKAVVEKGLPTLTAGLKDSSAAVREHTATAIGRFGGKATVIADDLWPLASDASPFVRESALHALRDVAAPTAGPLAKLLVSNDESLKRTAAEQLPLFRPLSPDCVSALAAALADADPFIRTTAASELALLGPKAAPAANELVAALKAAARTMKLDDVTEADIAPATALATIGEPSVGPVVKLLADKDTTVKWLALYVLGEIGPAAKAATQDLLRLELDPSGDVAYEAARADVTITGDTSRVKGMMTAALTSKLPVNRAAGLRILARMGKAGQPLAALATTLLADDEPVVRRFAVAYVATLDAAAAKAAVPELAKRLGDPEIDVRNVAAEVLAEIGPDGAPAAVALGKVAGDIDTQTSRTACDALAALGTAGSAAVPDLLALAADAKATAASRAGAIRAVAAVAPDDAKVIQAVVGCLADPADEVRSAAITVCGTLKSPSAAVVSKLAELVEKDRSTEVRALAAQALATLGPKAVGAKDKLAVEMKSPNATVAAWSTIALALVDGRPADAAAHVRGSLASKNPRLRAVAVQALAAVVTPQAADLPAVIEASRDRAALAREAASVALGRFGEAKPEAVQRLAAMLKDRDDDVRLAAAYALGGFGADAAPALPSLKELGKGKDSAARVARKLARALDRDAE